MRTLVKSPVPVIWMYLGVLTKSAVVIRSDAQHRPSPSLRSTEKQVGKDD